MLGTLYSLDWDYCWGLCDLYNKCCWRLRCYDYRRVVDDDGDVVVDVDGDGDVVNVFVCVFH